MHTVRIFVSTVQIFNEIAFTMQRHGTREFVRMDEKRPQQDSNLQPSDPKSDALTIAP